MVTTRFLSSFFLQVVQNSAYVILIKTYWGALHAQTAVVTYMWPTAEGRKVWRERNLKSTEIFKEARQSPLGLSLKRKSDFRQQRHAGTTDEQSASVWTPAALVGTAWETQCHKQQPVSQYKQHTRQKLHIMTLRYITPTQDTQDTKVKTHIHLRLSSDVFKRRITFPLMSRNNMSRSSRSFQLWADSVTLVDEVTLSPLKCLQMMLNLKFQIRKQEICDIIRQVLLKFNIWQMSVQAVFSQKNLLGSLLEKLQTSLDDLFVLHLSF